MNTIFIQIASYRDPELLPTLKDCISNAKYPENLRFGICWQHAEEDTWDNLDEYKNDSRFRIIDVNYSESKGVCWARNAVQKEYKGEKYTLQIDSHHRFIKNWDDVLIKMVKKLQKKGYKKPLLTAYIPSYNPQNDPAERVQEPWWMTFDRFIPEGAVFFLPATIPGWKNIEYPVPARFYSAHFCFTLGEFCVEVPHDPNYYFHGEEISIAVRAYTWGYDLFHPHRVVAWHEYTRRGRKKQWDDDSNWVERNTVAHKRNRALFGIDGECRCGNNFNGYDFGTERTLAEYEAYSGLRFRDRSVQQYTLDNNFAPNPKIENPEEYNKSFLKIFKHCIDLQYSQVPESDYHFWCVAFENDKGETIYRKDVDESEIGPLYRDPDGYIKIWRSFHTEERPVKWVVWPYSKSKGWCEKLEGSL
jgi:glycosyltransferase involved in cell wall biosynthesis